MKNSNIAVIEALKLVLKRMDRLREGFRLEKEAVLERPDVIGLETLMDRSRNLYRIRLADCRREMLILGRRISQDLPAWEDAKDLFDQCEAFYRDLEAHLVSTPHRLLRVYRDGLPWEEE
jgi:hypothetical protein